MLKNLLLTAVMVIGATIATSACAGIMMLVLGSLPDEMPSDPGLAAFGVTLMGLFAAVFGGFFCAVTLFFAALTMPPALLVTHWLKLPRPAMDIIGGGATALLCAMVGVDIFAHDKFVGMVAGQNAQIAATVALVIGCLLGYWRHAALVKPAAAPFAQSAT